jgi:hypothetical protein
VRRALALFVLLAAAAPAEARRPVIAYVEEGTQLLRFHDTQTGGTLPGPSLAIPNPIRAFGVSPDGRFVAFHDASKVTRLYDRELRGERALPGIAGFPRSVSNDGVIGLDGADNGPGTVYDWRTGGFVDIGFAADNGHRMSHISGDGRVLATTCVTTCISDTGGDSDVFVQDIPNVSDTAFPDDLSGADALDEEHPCVDGDGSIAGADVSVGGQRDVFFRDRATGMTFTPEALNRADADEVYCVLDSTGDYVGVADNNGGLRVLERSTGIFLDVPAAIQAPGVWLVEPYADLRLSGVKAAPRRVRRGARAELRFRINQPATAQVTLLRGGKVVARKSDAAEAGLNVVRVPTGARPGRYRVTVGAVDGAGFSAPAVDVSLRILKQRRRR